MHVGQLSDSMIIIRVLPLGYPRLTGPAGTLKLSESQGATAADPADGKAALEDTESLSVTNRPGGAGRDHHDDHDHDHRDMIM